jgi:hypothetical protein
MEPNNIDRDQPVNVSVNNSSRTPVAITIIVAVVIILVAILLIIKLPTESNSGTSSEIESGSDTIIFNKATLVPELTIRDIENDVETRIYLIGKIDRGEYKGNYLLAGRSLYISRIDQIRSGIAIISDVYYIADAKYKPLAWDKNFFNFYEWGDDTSGAASVQIGLSNSINKDLSAILPDELSNLPFIKVDGYDFFLNSMWDTSDLIAASTTKQIAATSKGYPILKYDGGELPDTYYVLLPTDLIMEIHPTQLNIDSNIRWSNGTISTSSYSYSSTSRINREVWIDCFENRSLKSIDKLVTQAGHTDTGDPLYILDFEKYAKNYKCLHENYNRRSVTDLTYKAFIDSYPLFFWKHPVTNNFILFVKSSVNDEFGGR